MQAAAEDWADAAIALPTLEAMLDGNGEAYAAPNVGDSAIPRRFAVVFFGNGVLHEVPGGTGTTPPWLPAGTKLWQPAATGAARQLSDALGALAPVKDYVNLVTGHEVKAPNYPQNAHHLGAASILAATPTWAPAPQAR